MKINHEVIMKALDSFGPDAALESGIPLADLVERVHTITGIQVPAKAVRAAVHEVMDQFSTTSPDEPSCEFVGKNSVRLVTPARRLATLRAQELATLLDGTARYSVEPPYAIVELSVATAAQFAKLAGLKLSWEKK